MRRGINVAALALALTGLAVRAGDPPAPAAKTPSPTAQVTALVQEFEKAFEPFAKEFRQATSVDERKKLLAEKDPRNGFADKFVALADKLGKDPAALSAIDWVFETAPRAPAVTAAFKLLERDHLESKEIVQYVMAAAGEDMPGAEAFLDKVRAQSPHELVRGVTTYALGQLYVHRAESARAPVDGKPNLAAADAAEKKAADAFEQVMAKYAAVSVGKDTKLGDVTKGWLHEIRNLAIGKPMPELVSEDLEGKKVSLSQLRGKVVVIDAWATTCGPCRAMLPHLRTLTQRHTEKPFALVSVSFDESKDAVREFQKKEAMPWTNWFNGTEGPLVEALHIWRFPTLFVLDAKGTIRFKDVRGEELAKAVDTLLAEMK